jgi:OmpA-OmpF porin, OOP family
MTGEDMNMRLARLLLTSAIASGVLAAAPVNAQTADMAALTSLEGDSLVSELTRLYEDALATSQDPGITAANDSRHLWAIEAKVQCGIALGYTKSGTRDEPSISKCARASAMMKRKREMVVAPPPPPPPPRRPDYCNETGPATVFFEFDSTEITPDAVTILNTVAQQANTCGWASVAVVGHTDQAGSDQYNLGLSQKRADAVATALRTKVAAGVQVNLDAKGESNPRVPLADGTRSPENRRVEITAK